MIKKGREVSFGIFLVFFLEFFSFFGFPMCFPFFFWYFPFILLDFPVNSDVFFTFVLFFLAVPCVSYFLGFCSFHFATFFVTTNETWVLLHLFVLHVLFCSSVFFLVLLFFFLRAVLGRGVAVRGVILKNKSWRGIGGEGAAPPPQMHWVLLHLFVLHFLFCSSVFIPSSYVFWFFVCSWKRCGGERSHP